MIPFLWFQVTKLGVFNHQICDVIIYYVAVILNYINITMFSNSSLVNYV